MAEKLFIKVSTNRILARAVLDFHLPLSLSLSLPLAVCLTMWAWQLGLLSVALVKLICMCWP